MALREDRGSRRRYAVLAARDAELSRVGQAIA
jgi:hypothetical protein